MRAETEQRWKALCERASIEQDSSKLMSLVDEIIRLLDENATRTIGGLQINTLKAA
jgi:hypothetical protein